MATVNPFRAVRPTRDKVSLVTTRSYELYRKKERNCILEYNPYSFLHVLRPGFKYHKRVTGKERFRMVHNRYEEFLENGVLRQDDKPAFYLHQKEYLNTRFWGIVGLASLDDYENDIIKKLMFNFLMFIKPFNCDVVIFWNTTLDRFITDHK